MCEQDESILFQDEYTGKNGDDEFNGKPDSRFIYRNTRSIVLVTFAGLMLLFAATSKCNCDNGNKPNESAKSSIGQ
jgi:hypothetical protein|tara:strand:+ start:127 stop:354 length:228 start_codon:yes stop_codon:yes gene_type:complete